jgi:phage tail sheath protein FI
LGTTFTGGTRPQTQSFISGADGSAATTGQVQTGYDLFRSSEDVDISLLLGSSADTTLAVHLINNIAEVRKDCIVCLSPERADVVNNNTNDGDEANDVIAFRNSLPSTSFAVLDSGWKYQFDKYNDIFRYVPLNGDTAGTMVRTDQVRDPWYSPAGFNRGQIKNVVKLAFNPRKSERDLLYKNGINPVTTFPGQGTVLFGDKTLLASPSAFDRINVRRLFITLEKAIAIAAQSQLFEFNDEFTRAQFVNLVEPFLRDVQGRRGITDFRVVADETNNTAEVIDRNEFVGDIFIKPARSINFIQLNFVAVRTGVEFSEIVGSV